MGVVCDLPVGELYAIAQQAARRYCRLMPWLEIDDVAQAAVVEMLEAAQRARAVPDSWAAYLGRVAHLTVRAYAWTTTAPVTLSSDRARMPEQAREALRVGTDHDDRSLPAEQPEALEGARWAREVRGRVRRAVSGDDPVDQELARQVLLEDVEPAEAASAAGVPARRVYVVTQRVKNRILRDAQVNRLWREMPSREGKKERARGN